MKLEKSNARNGWRTVKLGEVCELNPRRPKLDRATSTPTTFVQMSAVAENGGGIVRPETRPFGQVAKGYTFFAEGDVIFAKITPCMQNGKHAIASNLLDGIGFGSTEFHVFRPGGEIISEWILNFLLQPKILTEATRHFTGAVGQLRVPENVLANMEIALPPKDEQRRLAARLREQMSEVDRARASVQAQLDAAQNLPAALLRAIFTSPAAQRWPKHNLGDLLEDARNGLYKPDQFCGHGTPILKMFNIGRLNGQWDLTRVDKIEVTVAEQEQFGLLVGDIMFNRVNSRELVGKCAVVDESTAGAVFESKNMRLRLKTNVADPIFVATFLNSHPGRLQIEKRTRQIIGMATVNRSDLNSFEIVLPSIQEQRKFVSRLDAELTVARTLVEMLETRLAEIELLPAALLRQAFNPPN